MCKIYQPKVHICILYFSYYQCLNILTFEVQFPFQYMVSHTQGILFASCFFLSLLATQLSFLVPHHHVNLHIRISFFLLSSFVIFYVHSISAISSLILCPIQHQENCSNQLRYFQLPHLKKIIPPSSTVVTYKVLGRIDRTSICPPVLIMDSLGQETPIQPMNHDCKLIMLCCLESMPH